MGGSCKKLDFSLHLSKKIFYIRNFVLFGLTKRYEKLDTKNKIVPLQRSKSCQSSNKTRKKKRSITESFHSQQGRRIVSVWFPFLEQIKNRGKKKDSHLEALVRVRSPWQKARLHQRESGAFPEAPSNAEPTQRAQKHRCTKCSKCHRHQEPERKVRNEIVERESRVRNKIVERKSGATNKIMERQSRVRIEIVSSLSSRTLNSLKLSK